MIRCLCIAGVLLVCMFQIAGAVNNIDVLVDTIYGTPSTYSIPFGWENDVTILGAADGFRLSTTGGLTAQFVPGTLVPANRGIGAFSTWNTNIVGSANDSICIGGVAFPGINPGVVPGGMDTIFYQDISITGTSGTICIDSCTLIPPACNWLWDDGTGPVIHTFNQTGNSHCITYGVTTSNNNVEVLADSIAGVPSSYSIPFGWENDVTILGAMDTYRLSTTGNITAQFTPSTLLPTNRAVGAFMSWNSNVIGTANDSICIGGAYMPPVFPGVPPGPMDTMYYQDISITGTLGSICIDSCTHIPPACDWLWDDGMGPVIHTFNQTGNTHCIPCGYSNNIMVMVDSIGNNNDTFDIPFGYENNALIKGAANGFALSTTGTITASYVPGGMNVASHPGNRSVGALIWSAYVAGVNSDTICFGGPYMPPTHPGVAPGPLDTMVFIPIAISGDSGRICFDSCAFVPPACDWIWDDGTGNMNPSFNQNGNTYCVKYYLMEDLVIRDCSADNCVSDTSYPAPCSVYWKSPDIWTGQFNLCQAPVAGAVNKLYIRFWNNGAPADSAYVKCYYVKASLGLKFPSVHCNQIIDFVTAEPKKTVYSVGNWPASLGGLGYRTYFNWNIPANPPTGPDHWCIGCIVYNENDEPKNDRAQFENNLAQINYWAFAQKAGTVPKGFAKGKDGMTVFREEVNVYNPVGQASDFVVLVEELLPGFDVLPGFETEIYLGEDDDTSIIFDFIKEDGTHGDSSPVIINLYKMPENELVGGLRYELMIDDMPPEEVGDFDVDFVESEECDYMVYQLSWNEPTTDTGGNQETINYYQIHCSTDSASLTELDSSNYLVHTMIDSDTAEAGFQYVYCPPDSQAYYFTVFPVDLAGGEGGASPIKTAVLYICGDANYDEMVNVADAVWIINYVFAGGDPPYPLEAGDTNCDDTCNVADAVWIINYIFAGGYIPCDTNGDGEPDC